MSGRFRIVLDKEDFKFSAAHFTVFSHAEAELLHGHNYRVVVELTGDQVDELGFLVEFQELKSHIRALCARLDSRTLIPARNPHLAITTREREIEIEYAGRRYLLPQQEVILLELKNSTVELFAQWFWRELRPHLDRRRVALLGVAVQETDGQRCYYEGAIDDAG